MHDRRTHLVPVRYYFASSAEVSVLGCVTYILAIVKTTTSMCLRMDKFKRVWKHNYTTVKYKVHKSGLQRNLQEN